MRIQLNHTWTQEEIEKFRKKIENNSGYCPCRIKKIPENKCVCLEFINSKELGECHCGLYEKIEM